MVVKIAGKRMWLRRAVDDEELGMLVQGRRNTGAALRMLRKLLKRQRVRPHTSVTAGLASYHAASRKFGCSRRHRPRRMLHNNRPENSLLVIRRRGGKRQKFKCQRSVQRFLATHAAVTNNVNIRRRLIKRSTLRLFRADADRA